MSKTKADEKWDSIEENPLVIISEIRRMMSEARAEWAEDLEQFLQDEDVNKVIDLVIRMIGGDIPEASKVAVICVRLEAYNVKFRSQFASYMGMKKGTTDANAKKNHYKELYTGIDRLVDSLKYLVKT